MRFLVSLESQEPATLRLDYRSRFISLLKRVFGAEEFEQDSTRPYTFSVYFGKEAKVSKEGIGPVRFINLRFSTGDPSYALKFYNGITSLKGKTHKIGTGDFVIKEIRMQKEGDWSSGLFKTLSPVVVERLGAKDRSDPKERYIVPFEEGFEESLLHTLIKRFTLIKGYEPSLSSFKLRVQSFREDMVKHYGGYVRCFMGTFKVHTDNPELLKFVYQFGLGLRTGQGFGYLEVL